jgi:hypothetical protein
VLEACPEKPEVEGKIVDGNVVVSFDDAVRLRDWIAKYQICSESNRIRLQAQVEKLENRLEALRD